MINIKPASASTSNWAKCVRKSVVTTFSSFRICARSEVCQTRCRLPPLFSYSNLFKQGQSNAKFNASTRKQSPLCGTYEFLSVPIKSNKCLYTTVSSIFGHTEINVNAPASAVWLRARCVLQLKIYKLCVAGCYHHASVTDHTLSQWANSQS